MFESYKEIDVNWLKQNNTMIHFFGLGFIQVKINDEYRLHFFSEELTPFVETPHNHRYDFESKILKGQIKNNIYKLCNGNDYFVDKDSCQSGYKSEFSPILTGFELVSSNIYRQGEKYTMKHDVFHTVESNNCITLLKRGKYFKNLADISYFSNEMKICPFSQNINEKELWRIVSKMLND